MVSTFYPPYNFGGDGMHIYRLSNELARRGHSVDVFHCEDAFLLLNKDKPTADFPNHPQVKVHGLKSRAGFLSPLLTQQTGVPFFKNELKNALETNDYDVIHYHNMSLIGITALSYGSAIKLYTTHEHWLICPMQPCVPRWVCRLRARLVWCCFTRWCSRRAMPTCRPWRCARPFMRQVCRCCGLSRMPTPVLWVFYRRWMNPHCLRAHSGESICQGRSFVRRCGTAR